MKYHEIAPMCRPSGGVRGCPHDGLGCIGGEKCSINSPDAHVSSKAFNAGIFGPDFICQKRLSAIKRKSIADTGEA